MIPLFLTPDQDFIAVIVGKERHKKALSMNQSSCEKQHIEGARTEMVLAEYLGLYWNPKVGICGGADIGKLIEVKSTPIQNGHLIINDRIKDDWACCLLIGECCSYNWVGWEFAEKVKETGVINVKNGDKTYWLHKEYLRICETFDPFRLRDKWNKKIFDDISNGQPFLIRRLLLYRFLHHSVRRELVKLRNRFSKTVPGKIDMIKLQDRFNALTFKK